MIHDFITLWDHDLGFVSMCGISVCFSWPEYWLYKLNILQVYHIMPLIDAQEIFSWYHMYILTGSHFTQIFKMALLSIFKKIYTLKFAIFMKSTRFCPKNLADFMHLVKSIRFHPWNLLDFMKSARFHGWNQWNQVDFMKSTTKCQMSQEPMVLFCSILTGHVMSHDLNVSEIIND